MKASPPDRVHVAITHQAKPGKEAEYEAALREFARTSLHEPGTTGVLLLAPVPGTYGCEFGILRSFESQEACDAFYQSERFREFYERTKPLVVDKGVRRKLHGLEAFFRTPNSNPPPKWKMAIITWLAVFPSSWLWSTALPPLLPNLPDLFVRALVNVFVVITLAWLVMPWFTRWFIPWLYPPVQHIGLPSQAATATSPQD
ncbi:antibiotic biosynthesis monooxygenase [Bremerella cremea]|uniref:Antibiotic biosynthesis monooxygenase n=1 Tax=Bremerella cremea TaxID=1031537 RepID=A0A368KRH2_9BACT|nr:antibiotic biosynthesis monooxygenase [Bremerella cremea]RCS49406.1 antibiotic biosynthesis monooxygenase [Bremerella cremea]